MSLLRKHWFDLGGLLALVAAVYLATSFKAMGAQQIILWLSLVSLFIHQLEEYRYHGYFPGMVNAAVYQSDRPDRYPLNTQTSLVVNVVMGWVAYLLAALLGSQCIWLGIATVLISLGNFFAHTLFFNIKGKTFYNPGMITGIMLFLPIAIWYYTTILADTHTRMTDWLIGVPLGIVLNYLGIVKLIDWLANRNTTYVFENRQLRPADQLS
jgi:hypothetical protein